MVICMALQDSPVAATLVSAATALLVEIIWHLPVLIFGTHRLLLTQQSTHLRRNVVDSGVFTQ